MAISLHDLLDDDIESMRDQASANDLPYLPFTMRELITPQYRVNVDSSEERWRNWVYQHDEQNRIEYRPTNRRQLVAAVVQQAYNDRQIRAVGSGHSHSNAPAPADHYIELNPGDPGDTGGTGLNSRLPNGDSGTPAKWLKDDGSLNTIQERRRDNRPDHLVDREFQPLDREHLLRVQSGVMLRRLNRHLLHPNGYALKNMGSFDGQTIAGAVNTSTHGTGIELASIADSVESVEIATVPESASGDPIVRLYRIEPADGITDREAFEADTADHEMELIQDDDLFHSVVVGYGCMGVVYAYTLHVRDDYWLKETTKLMDWDSFELQFWDEDKGAYTKEKALEFLNGPDGNARHTQILVNIASDQLPQSEYQTHEGHGIGTHETVGNPLVLVKRHYTTTPNQKPDDWADLLETGKIQDPRWPPERRKKSFRDATKVLGQINPLAPNLATASRLHKGLFHSAYRRDPFVNFQTETAWYVALRRLRDRAGPNTDPNYHPQPPSPPTMTTEVGVALENLIPAANAIRKRVRPPNPVRQDPIPNKTWSAGDRPVFFAIPMGIRFTAASEHHLSPEHGRDTAMLEVPMPVNALDANIAHETPKLSVDEIREYVAEPALNTLHNHLVFTGDGSFEFDARPHMGKHNTVGAGWMNANYDYFDAANTDKETGWYQAYQRFNAFGTFDNKFTDQLDLDGYTAGDAGTDLDDAEQ